MKTILAWAPAALLAAAGAGAAQNAAAPSTRPSTMTTIDETRVAPTTLPTSASTTSRTTTQRSATSIAPTTATTLPAFPLPPPMPARAAVAQPDAGNEGASSRPGEFPAPPVMPTAPPVTQPGTEPADVTPSTTPTDETEPAATQPNPAGQGQLRDVVVTADLDKARANIAPSLGAQEFTIGPNQIQDTPGGENAPFQQVLLRAPGVVEDSFGQEHVRGEHSNLTYRVDGVILPTSIGSLGGFGQELDTRIINSITLIDGSLPAQFGFRTAGVVDVTTKSGDALHNEFSVYGGSYDTFQPSLQLGGTTGKLDYFFVGSYKYSGLGVEDPTSSNFPSHDYTNQARLFGYLGYRIDDTSRLMLLLNGSNGTFQIPDRPGQAPAFMLAGHASADSTRINENQNEHDNYEVVSYQKTLDRLSFQVSGFSRYGVIHFSPDPVNDLIFQGVAGKITNGFLTNGIQFDASYILDDHNTVRFGLLADYTSETLNTTTHVFPVDATGSQASDIPFIIQGNGGNWGSDTGFYLQDEWKITDHLTLNYGARYDRFDASFDQEDQISPRANLVWQIDKRTTAHAGYARYFAPPPVQYVGAGTVATFAGTTNAPATFRDDQLRAERSNYYDIGLSRQVAPPWQVSVDAFYKGAKPLLDSGQFGNAIILAPFNYRIGKVYGAEFSSQYKQGGLSLFSNFAWVSATGKDISSSQYLIASDDLAYISKHYIRLDHESEYTISAGVSYTWKNNRVYADLLYGSGLRAGFANLQKEPDYYPVNVGFEHIFHPDQLAVKDVRFRFDVVNVFDQTYQLRNGTGIGVGAPQYGARRGFYAGLTFDF